MFASNTQLLNEGTSKLGPGKFGPGKFGLGKLGPLLK